jgi:hypothetical protein
MYFQTAKEDYDPSMKLISAVIALAVADCCDPPLKDKKHCTLTDKALDAFRFLFGKNKYCQIYLELLDIDLDSFRRHLVSTMYADKQSQDITDQKKRCFRMNHARFVPTVGKT